MRDEFRHDDLLACRCLSELFPAALGFAHETLDQARPATVLGVLPKFKRELQLKELQAAREARIDALVTVYHSDHRELCAHEVDWPFRILNLLELVGASMGLARRDRYKELKILQDAD